MTSPIVGYLPGTPTPISQATATPPSATTSTSSGGGTNLDENAFLKLLVAQLKYQDPDKPADSAQFMAQTAQFTQVQKLDAMAKGQQQLLSAEQMLGASSLLGRTVTVTGDNGKDTTGVVTSAAFSGGTATVRVGGADVPLSSVKQVRTSPTA